MADGCIARFRAVVEEARNECASPDSAPAVTQVLVSQYLDRLMEPSLQVYVVVNGLNSLVRRVFKALADGEDDEARQLQLAEWPTSRMRALVARINHSMIFVPSRGTFVELVPDALTIVETREAGEYLIGQGEDTIRRGRLLLDLADERGAQSRPRRRPSGHQPEAPPPP